MNMKLSSIALAVAFMFTTAAQAQTNDRSARKAEEDRIEQQAKADKAKCQSLSGNAEDVCEAEAKAKEKTAKAELNAKYDKSVKAQRNAADTKAEGQYEVAKQRCDDKKGQEKDACMAQAKATHEKAKAQIQAQFDQRKDSTAATGNTSEKPKRQ